MSGESTAPVFQGIGDVISTKWLQVPMYQRSYAWEVDHVNALFDDLSNAISSDPQYFLGSIIMTPVGEDRLEVVDGHPPGYQAVSGRRQPLFEGHAQHAAVRPINARRSGRE